MSGEWYRLVSRWSHRWEWHHARVMGPLEPGGGYVRRCDWCGWSEGLTAKDVAKPGPPPPPKGRPRMSEGDTLCVCGHAEQDHHTSWFVPTGAKLVEECEHPDEDVQPWDKRCQHFKAPEGKAEDEA